MIARPVTCLHGQASRLDRDLTAIMALVPANRHTRRSRKRCGKVRNRLFTFLEHPDVPPGKVDDWRGGGRLRGELFSGGFHHAGALSIRTVAPFPVAARQTGHADFPHPAFSRPVKPSLSAGRRVAVGRCRGRASRRDTRLGSGGTQCLVVRTAHQPAADPSFSVCSNELINLYDRTLVKVAAPTAYQLLMRPTVLTGSSGYHCRVVR